MNLATPVFLLRDFADESRLDVDLVLFLLELPFLSDFSLPLPLDLDLELLSWATDLSQLYLFV